MGKHPCRKYVYVIVKQIDSWDEKLERWFKKQLEKIMKGKKRKNWSKKINQEKGIKRDKQEKMKRKKKIKMNERDDEKEISVRTEVRI